MTNHLPGLVLTPTPAMRAGTQHVWQHSQCGTVVVTPSTSPANSLGRCPNPSCRRPEAPWWRQQLPVAGLSAAAPANPAPLIRTRPVTMTAQTRSDPMTMRRATAETIRDGQGWYWPANSRTAHYYLKDHRTACGRGLVLLLPDDLDGFHTSHGWMYDTTTGVVTASADAWHKPGVEGDLTITLWRRDTHDGPQTRLYRVTAPNEVPVTVDLGILPADACGGQWDVRASDGTGPASPSTSSRRGSSSP